MEAKRFREVIDQNPNGDLWVLSQAAINPGDGERFRKMVQADPDNYRVIRDWVGWQLLKRVPSTQAVGQVSQGEEKM